MELVLSAIVVNPIYGEKYRPYLSFNQNNNGFTIRAEGSFVIEAIY